MQALNLERSLIYGLNQDHFKIFLFDGTMPASIASIPFDPLNHIDLQEHCVAEISTTSSTHVSRVGGGPSSASVNVSTMRTSYTKDNFLGPGDPTDPISTFTVPSRGWRIRPYGGSRSSWRNNNDFRALSVDNSSYINCGYDGPPYFDLFFGGNDTPRAISGFRYRQHSIRAEYSAGVTRVVYAWARTLRPYALLKNADETFSWSQLPDISSGTGLKTHRFAAPVDCYGLRVVCQSGYGTTIGLPNRNKNRGWWAVSYAAAIHHVEDGATAGQSRFPTWGIIVHTTPSGLDRNTIVLGTKGSYAGQSFDYPVSMIDVGAPGSGATLELIQYPVEPGVSPQIHKLNLNINS